MRLSSLLIAAFVCAFVWLAVMERPLLMAFAGVEQQSAAEEAPDATEREGEKPPVSVVVLKSQAQPVARGIVLRGKTEAFRSVDVKSETTGTVISQPLRRGAIVEEGQILCELDPGTREAALDEARARLKEAEANYKVATTLAENGYAPETTAIARAAALEAAKAAVLQAEKELEKLKIHAPFGGLMENDAAEYGALLQPGQTCAQIIQLDPIKLVGYATELQVRGLKVGAPAGARLIDGREVRGEITFVARSADPVTRTFRVEVTVPNTDLSIRDGSSAQILIGLDGGKAHLVPQSALTLDDAGRLGVRVVVDGKAWFRSVTIVNEIPDGVWVTGLEETAEVIIVGQEYVTDGRAVSVTYKGDGA